MIAMSKRLIMKTLHSDLRGQTFSRTSWLAVLACSSCLVAPSLSADNCPGVDFGGFFFGDLYHVPSHHTDEADGASGLVLRRQRSSILSFQIPRFL